MIWGGITPPRYSMGVIIAQMKVNMSPLSAIKFGVANTFQFKGRTTRSEFWSYAAFVAIVAGLAAWLDFGLFTAIAYDANGDLMMLRTNHEVARLIGPILLLTLSAACFRRLRSVGGGTYWSAIPATASLFLFFLIWSGQFTSGRGVIDMGISQAGTVDATITGYLVCFVATLLPAVLPFWLYAKPDSPQLSSNEVPS